MAKKEREKKSDSDFHCCPSESRHGTTQKAFFVASVWLMSNGIFTTRLAVEVKERNKKEAEGGET